MILNEPEEQRIEIDDQDDESCNFAGFDFFALVEDSKEDVEF